MPTSPCGLFDSEVFVDREATYVGDFSYADGPGGPFGWVACQNFCESNFFFGIFNSFKPPYCFCLTYVGTGVPFAFGVDSAVTVVDSSGPTGLESSPAMKVNLPGAADTYIAWAGTQVVDETTGAWKTGVLNASTGWDPQAGETWIFSCWAKSVPDINSVTADDINMNFSIAVPGLAPSDIGDSLLLTDEWQFYSFMFDGGLGGGGFKWPLINFNAPANVVAYTGHFFDTPVDLMGYDDYGSVLIKCAHLYQPAPPTSNWAATFHGHGPAV